MLPSILRVFIKASFGSCQLKITELTKAHIGITIVIRLYNDKVIHKYIYWVNKACEDTYIFVI